MIIDFIDPVNRRIYLHPDTVGEDVHPIDIYKEMRTHRRVDESLRSYDVFLAAYGNVSKGGGKATERYVQCLDGTRIVPYDTTHVLAITGTIITDEGTAGVYCFDRSLLAISSNVDIDYQPPQVEVVTVSGGSGLDEEQDNILKEIHSGVVKMVHVDANNPTEGDGSPTSPFWNIDLAVSYGNVKGIKALHIHSDIVFDVDVQGFEIWGFSNPTIDLNGKDVTHTEFFNCQLSGSSTGSAGYDHCNLLDGTSGLNGVYRETSISGDVSIEEDAYVIFYNSFSGIPGSSRPSINLLNSMCSIALRSWSGGIEMRGAVDGAAITIGLNDGECRFDATCVGGDAHVRGTGFFENLGTTEVETRALVTSTPDVNDETIHGALDTYTNKDDFKADVSNLSADVNVVEVNGVAVTSVDDFKADVSNLDVDLSTIPQSVWEYVGRELSADASLTTAQLAKMNEILTAIGNIETSSGGNEWTVTI